MMVFKYYHKGDVVSEHEFKMTLPNSEECTATELVDFITVFLRAAGFDYIENLEINLKKDSNNS